MRDRVADDELRRELDLRIVVARAFDPLQEDLYGQGTHFADALAHARDGRIEVVEVGVVVERDDRDVVGNPESRLLDCLDRPQQDGVPIRSARTSFRDTRSGSRSRCPRCGRDPPIPPRAVRRDSPARVRVRASSGVLP